MVLVIDTKNQKVIAVSLKKKGKIIRSLREENQFGSQILLPLIEKILKQEKIDFKDLREIAVETGPGSFVGLRVGVSVANALGYSLKIPVNGKKRESDLVY